MKILSLSVALGAVLLRVTSAPATIFVSAFAPGMITSVNLAPNTMRMKIENSMIRRDKPARSQEEDLELTRVIIMKHISSHDDDYEDDDDDDDVIQNNISVKSKSVAADNDSDTTKMDAYVSSPNSSSPELGGLGDDDGGTSDAQQRMTKIKSFGTQIRDDLKSRFGKVREEGVTLQPLKNIKSFGAKIKDDLKSRLGKDD